MSPAEALRVIFRHWLIIAFGLILTVAATAYGFVSIPGTYSSTSVVMLLQRSTDASGGGENPYLNMDGSLTVTAAAVQRAVSDSPEMAAALTATDSSGTFLITPVMSGPFLQIDTGATSSAGALAIQQVVRDQMRRKLNLLQSSVGAPSKLQIQLNEVTQPTLPVAVLKRKLQFVGGILFGGLALTTSLAFLADRVRGRRKTSSTPHQNQEPSDAAVPESLLATFGSQQQPAESTDARVEGQGSGQHPVPRGPDPKLILRPNLSGNAQGEHRGPLQARTINQGPTVTAPKQRPANGRNGSDGRQQVQSAFPPPADAQASFRSTGQPRLPVAGYRPASPGRVTNNGQPDPTRDSWNDRSESGRNESRPRPQPGRSSWIEDDSPRLIGYEESAPTEAQPQLSQTRNGRNGFPTAPVTPESGWPLPDDGGWQRRPEERPAGRRPPARRDRN